MNHSELSKKAYNKIAETYEETFDGKFTESFKTLLLQEVKLHKHDRILDVACGTGTLLHQLSQLQEFEAYGIDIAEKMIAVAAARYPTIKFSVSDCNKIPFPNGFFNSITVCAAFHHFQNPMGFLAEASRLLTKDGHIYIAEVYWPPVLRQVFNLFLPLYRAGDVKVYSTNEMHHMLQAANFFEISLLKKGNIQLLSAKKKINTTQ